MGYTSLISIVAALVIGGIALKTVSPSMIDSIKVAKVDAEIVSREKAIFEAILRYMSLKGAAPSSINDLVSEGLFPSVSNNNGFGGVYSFTIDSGKGLVTISTKIPDATARAAYINSYKNTFKPTQGTGSTVLTTFVIPTPVLHGNGQFMAGIPVQSIAPSASANKYWYDTSGDTVVLKMSDGATWKTVSNPSSIASAGTVYSSLTELQNANPSAQSGDIKYAYDSSSGSVLTYTNYNGTWVISGGGVSSGGGASTGSVAPGVCPSGFVPIPGAAYYTHKAGNSDGGKGWCVAKSEMMYLPSANGGASFATGSGTDCYNGYAFSSGCGTARGVAKITAGMTTGYQVKQISRNEAEAMCQNYLTDNSGTYLDGGHLVDYGLWSRIVVDMAKNAKNWSGSWMPRGHSDGAPAYSLPISTDPTGGIADGSSYASAYYGTGQSSGEQGRVLRLSNGSSVWDWSGNLWEYLYETQNSGSAGWNEYTAQYGSPFSPQLLLGQNWSSANGIGQTYGTGSLANLGVNLAYNTYYGAGWDYGANGGAFSSSWGASSPSAYRGGSTGFRCVVPAR